MRCWGIHQESRLGEFITHRVQERKAARNLTDKFKQMNVGISTLKREHKGAMISENNTRQFVFKAPQRYINCPHFDTAAESSSELLVTCLSFAYFSQVFTVDTYPLKPGVDSQTQSQRH